MQLKPLPRPDIAAEKPSYDLLYNMLNDYRRFVGTEAAFHLEHVWWPGSFDNKEEEMDFYLSPEWALPDSYEALKRQCEEAREDEAKNYIRMIDAERDRKIYGWIAALLALPYMALLYYALQA